MGLLYLRCKEKNCTYYLVDKQMSAAVMIYTVEWHLKICRYRQYED